ncbi:sodium:solute symporter family domain protein [Cystoisospora suis]|uniref:Sodium:solute symporter family domain protein n=1 Tax=Cystoisospora suis TaxID=483139 RepID=A0A2C6L7W2_9APIC|nr:sodium:solute symporter family domain protein [Cystoisospora suis]
MLPSYRSSCFFSSVRLSFAPIDSLHPYRFVSPLHHPIHRDDPSSGTYPIFFRSFSLHTGCKERWFSSLSSSYSSPTKISKELAGHAEQERKVEEASHRVSASRVLDTREAFEEFFFSPKCLALWLNGLSSRLEKIQVEYETALLQGKEERHFLTRKKSRNPPSALPSVWELAWRTAESVRCKVSPSSLSTSTSSISTEIGLSSPSRQNHQEEKEVSSSPCSTSSCCSSSVNFELYTKDKDTVPLSSSTTTTVRSYSSSQASHCLSSFSPPYYLDHSGGQSLSSLSPPSGSLHVNTLQFPYGLACPTFWHEAIDLLLRHPLSPSFLQEERRKKTHDTSPRRVVTQSVGVPSQQTSFSSLPYPTEEDSRPKKEDDKEARDFSSPSPSSFSCHRDSSAPVLLEVRTLAMIANALVKVAKVGKREPSVLRSGLASKDSLFFLISSSSSSSPSPCCLFYSAFLSRLAGNGRPSVMQRAFPLHLTQRDLRELLLKLLETRKWEIGGEEEEEGESAVWQLNEQDASLLVNACAVAGLLYMPLFSALEKRLVVSSSCSRFREEKLRRYPYEQRRERIREGYLEKTEVRNSDLPSFSPPLVKPSQRLPSNTLFRQDGGEPFLSSFSPQGLSLLLHAFARLRVSVSPSVAAHCARAAIELLQIAATKEDRFEGDKGQEEEEEAEEKERQGPWSLRKKDSFTGVYQSFSSFSQKEFISPRSTSERKPRRGREDCGRHAVTPEHQTRLLYALYEWPAVPRPLVKSAALLLAQGKLRTHPYCFSIQGRLLALSCIVGLSLHVPECTQGLLLSLLRPTLLSSSASFGDVSVPTRQKASPPPAFSEQHFALLLHALAHTQSMTNFDTIGSSPCPTSQPKFESPVLRDDYLSLSPLQCLPKFLETHLEDFMTRATPQGLAIVFSAVAKLGTGRFPGIYASPYQAMTTSVQQYGDSKVSPSSSHVSCIFSEKAETAENDGAREEDLVKRFSADLLLVSCCERVFLGVNESPQELKSSHQTTRQRESFLADRGQRKGNRQLGDSCWVGEFGERVEKAHGKETQPGQFEKHKTSITTNLLAYSDLGQQEGLRRAEPRHIIACCFAAVTTFAACGTWYSRMLSTALRLPLSLSLPSSYWNDNEKEAAVCPDNKQDMFASTQSAVRAQANEEGPDTSRAPVSLLSLLTLGVSPREFQSAHQSEGAACRGNGTHTESGSECLRGVCTVDKHMVLSTHLLQKRNQSEAKKETLNDASLHVGDFTAFQSAFPSADDKTLVGCYHRPGLEAVYPRVLPVHSYTQLYTVLLHLLFEVPGGIRSLERHTLKAGLILLDTFHPCYVGLIKRNVDESATRATEHEAVGKGTQNFGDVRQSTSGGGESPPRFCFHHLDDDCLSYSAASNLPYTSCSPSEVLPGPHSPRTSLLHSQILKILRPVQQSDSKLEQPCVSTKGGNALTGYRQKSVYIVVSESLVMPYIVDIVLRPMSFPEWGGRSLHPTTNA